MRDTLRVLAVYRDIPLDNGDAILICGGGVEDVVQEIAGLADHWHPRVRDAVCGVLRDIDVGEVVVAIARPDAQLLPQDHALHADLAEELRDGPIRLHPLEALPAA
jgi:hypothetical protein